MKSSELKRGDKFRYLGDLCHVRGHVDGRLIYRRWIQSRRVWQYEVKHYFLIDSIRGKK